MEVTMGKSCFRRVLFGNVVKGYMRMKKGRPINSRVGCKSLATSFVGYIRIKRIIVPYAKRIEVAGNLWFVMTQFMLAPSDSK